MRRRRDDVIGEEFVEAIELSLIEQMAVEVDQLMDEQAIV